MKELMRSSKYLHNNLSYDERLRLHINLGSLRRVIEEMKRRRGVLYASLSYWKNKSYRLDEEVSLLKEAMTKKEAVG